MASIRWELQSPFMSTSIPEDGDIGSDMVPDRAELFKLIEEALDKPQFVITFSDGKNETFNFVPHLPHWLKNPEQSDRVRNSISEICLVSPGRMNGSSGWQMDTIREIWQGQEPEHDDVVHVFVTASGERLVDSDYRTDSRLLRSLTKIYSVNSPLASKVGRGDVALT